VQPFISGILCHLPDKGACGKKWGTVGIMVPS
jgi:hypothetical protein